MTETTEASAQAFLAARKTLVLATARKGVPTASYAPFVHDGEAFYIYTSALSRHTRDLLERKTASVLLINDESASHNLFARERITFTCAVTVVQREGTKWKLMMDSFEVGFGKPFLLIRPLADFTLFRLEPKEAVYVRGFGKAYRMRGDLKDPVHIQGTGPGAKTMDKKKPQGTRKR
ncbi:MAG: hypothetical protein A3C93_03205 [Candidatus Lloydbacteria bacterium RIFCSPHIGHO2_02_FULL_54_17]|uniref:Pyridoxamine 5'-phosphate oxidase N-terminal domain-containing protein n=1 Tax=Candidatus Lloydbacteria bacterium RIFCSPHIGHO2_02_FULL_54_17 TaxID=1798664 RepID=A0A1G2DEN0_9BACT|nr:MAG: hypothetical protein A2762_04225 [Candidatus Lloydbacteria bacterium RIFCSPHIGHO2_01_FULL_54_11]OGZ12094.1 MAG: hypothetical protein A3C93_03205 [Candidatus Lloydbacteria bacterium RIFCSPHIGHO2_02_FULL_54_17]OGZ13403.1 MAG: hypothetical protein A2948_01340 [Candidatus Lloydbacteria bacterium RIFCSPLOWO2_01_FULL_54_18]OGZ15765.1 MAG: hypothetical protein A3H76_06425 [Candidatus Lloydbacteria bacterium RIFCSPLOWO2_02_FULL_54_12]